MKRFNRNLLAVLLTALVLFGFASCATKASIATVGGATAAESVSFSGSVTEIQKYGNIVVGISPEAMKAAGYEYGDILAVTVNGKTFDIPFCTNYSDVDTGSLVARDAGDLVIAINMGDFATANGLAVKEKYEDGSYAWILPANTTLSDIVVEIEMGEKAGYRDEYLIHQLVRTNDRADYASDLVFANFRNIEMGEIGSNVLYRSSSPINNEIGRASYADSFASMTLVQCVMNLADNNDGIEAYIAADDFASPYYKHLYSSNKVVALNLGVDFSAAEFKSGLANGLKFFAANKGPYLVHCNEGKDRAGFVSALLEAYMGASFDEIVADYMKTYENYYHIESGSDQYEAVKNSNIVSILRTIAGVDKSVDVSTIDLAKAAEAYIASLGLTDAELASLKANLSMNY